MKNFISSMFIVMMIVIFQLTGACSSDGTKTNKEVQKAFDLRMKGQVDEAKTLLESILTKDSTDAMAHYEMARLKHYMFVGGGKATIDDIINSINKAVTCEPQNVVYNYYQAIAKFLKAFMAMQMQKEDVKGLVQETCVQFEKVLALKPDYHEAMLYLVEMYGILPPDMGGDSLKATSYAEKLAGLDSYYGAMAKAALAPENTDFVKLWEDMLAKDQKNPELMTEVGKAYLYKEDLTNAEKYFNEAMKADPSKSILILDLARYHIYTVMQNRDTAAAELPIAKDYIEKYLKSNPEPVVPLKAYATGLLALCEKFLGNQTESDKRVEEAKAMDPYFSRALGVPTLLLFDRPDVITHHYFSFFRPF
jgi:tetratricopeptide (TPR) repeat protein